MAIQIQLRRGTEAEWTAADPVLAEGELALSTDVKKFKVGDGVTAWSAITYFQGDPGVPGADGLTILNGAGAPGAGLGVDGDFYLDTTAWDIYGPKAGGAWGSGTSLVGTGLTNPMTTAGDIIVGDTGGAAIRLAKGADSQVLTVDPATHLLAWKDPTGGGGGTTLLVAHLFNNTGLVQGNQVVIPIPANCTIDACTILADASVTASFDLSVGAYADYPTFAPLTQQLGSFNLGGGYTEWGTAEPVVAGSRYLVSILGWDGNGTLNAGVHFSDASNDAWHTPPSWVTGPIGAGITTMKLIGRYNGANLVGTGWSYQLYGAGASIGAPTLSATAKSQDSTLTGWTTSLTGGQYLTAALTSIAGTAKSVAIILDVTPA